MKKFARSVVSYNLLVKDVLQGWEWLIEISGFNDRPEMKQMSF